MRKNIRAIPTDQCYKTIVTTSEVKSFEVVDLSCQLETGPGPVPDQG